MRTYACMRVCVCVSVCEYFPYYSIGAQYILLHYVMCSVQMFYTRKRSIPCVAVKYSVRNVNNDVDNYCCAHMTYAYIHLYHRRSHPKDVTI